MGKHHFLKSELDDLHHQGDVGRGYFAGVQLDTTSNPPPPPGMVTIHMGNRMVPDESIRNGPSDVLANNMVSAPKWHLSLTGTTTKATTAWVESNDCRRNPIAPQVPAWAGVSRINPEDLHRALLYTARLVHSTVEDSGGYWANVEPTNKSTREMRECVSAYIGRGAIHAKGGHRDHRSFHSAVCPGLFPEMPEDSVLSFPRILLPMMARYAREATRVWCARWDLGRKELRSEVRGAAALVIQRPDGARLVLTVAEETDVHSQLDLTAAGRTSLALSRWEENGEGFLLNCHSMDLMTALDPRPTTARWEDHLTIAMAASQPIAIKTARTKGWKYQPEMITYGDHQPRSRGILSAPIKDAIGGVGPCRIILRGSERPELKLSRVNDAVHIIGPDRCAFIPGLRYQSAYGDEVAPYGLSEF